MSYVTWMDTDSFYLAMSGDSLHEVIRPGLKQAYELHKNNGFVTDKLSEKVTGLFKTEFVGTRGVWVTAKCCLAQDQNKIVR